MIRVSASLPEQTDAQTDPYDMLSCQLEGLSPRKADRWSPFALVEETGYTPQATECVHGEPTEGQVGHRRKIPVACHDL